MENVNTELQRCYIDISRIGLIAQNVAPKTCMLPDGMTQSIIFNKLTMTGKNKGGLIRLMLLSKPLNITMTNSDFIDAVWQAESYGVLSGYQDNISECPKITYSYDLFENNTQINSEMLLTNIPFQIFMQARGNTKLYNTIIMRNNYFKNIQYRRFGLMLAF